jgi:hypothetical protein
MTKVTRTWAPLVISTLALFAALGGVGWARTLINGGTIEKNSIPVNRLTKSAQRALAGKRGPIGPIGHAGPKGSTGASGATHVVVRSQTFIVPPAGAFNATTQCDPGEVAVGGGAGQSNGAMGGGVISTSIPADRVTLRPTPNGGVPTAWNVVFTNTSGSSVSQSASVVCASP